MAQSMIDHIVAVILSVAMIAVFLWGMSSPRQGVMGQAVQTCVHGLALRRDGAPAGIKAVLIDVWARDSGASPGSWIMFGPTSGIAGYSTAVCLYTPASDEMVSGIYLVTCDANGDIYYRINASGTLTMDVWLVVWGYAL